MAINKTQSEVQILENYRVALTNAVTQPEVSATLAVFGYTAEKIAIGNQLLDETTTAYNTTKKETNETVSARADFDNKASQVETVYSLHRKKAKVVFRKDEVALKQLGLIGSNSQAYAKWLEEVKLFYSVLQSNKTLLSQLESLNVNAEEINTAVTTIKELENARAIYLKEIGESQDATKAKDIAFAKLDDWMRDFYAVSKIAMEDKPQLLETMGILVRS